MTVSIIYASETGTIQSLAEQAQKLLQNNSISSTIIAADQCKPENFTSNFIYLTSTYYNGEHPESAQYEDGFFAMKKELKPALQGKKFAIYGIGSTSYDDFNKAAIEAEKDFLSAGGVRMMESFKLDVDGDDDLDAKLVEFVTLFVKAI